METTCQRCHEVLRNEDRYCPVCGLPQLTYVAGDGSVVAGDSTAQGNNSTSSGLSGSATGIIWRPALKVALMLAIPAGVLCSGITPIGPSLGLLWIGGAAAWAVGLYFKRAQPGWLSTGAGARIGLVTGLIASWFAISVSGIDLWVGRFVLHQGGQMDSLWTEQANSSLQMNQQMTTVMGLTAPQAAESMQFLRSVMFSPEGRAGVMVWTLILAAMFLVCFATIGGAVGARLLAQPRRPRA